MFLWGVLAQQQQVDLGLTPVLVAFDEFTDSNGVFLPAHTMNIGTGWLNAGQLDNTTHPPGNYTNIQGNQVQITLNAQGVVTETGATDVLIELDWTPTASANQRNSIYVRRTAEEGPGMFMLNFRKDNGDIQIWDYNGVSDTVLQNTSFTWNAGQTYKIGILCEGPSMKAYVDDVEVLSVASTKYSHGSWHGFGRNTGSDEVRIDNFKVYSMPPSGRVMIFLDNFTDTDSTLLTAHTPDIGANWTMQEGTMSILSNLAKNDVLATHAVVETGKSDVEIEMTRVNSGPVGIIFRSKDTSNYWNFWGEDSGLYEITGGVQTKIGHIGSGTKVPDGSVMKVRCEGNTITLQVDDGPTFVHTSTVNQFFTKHGIRGYDASNVRVDQFTIWALGTPWTPAQLSPDAWLDPSDRSTVTLDGSGNISQIDDKSGNDRHVTQATEANRPAYDKLNGLIVADGVTEQLTATGAFNDADGTVNSFGFFCVAKPNKAGNAAGSQGSSGTDYNGYASYNNNIFGVGGNTGSTGGPVAPFFSVSTDYIANTDTRNSLAPYNIKRSHSVGANLGLFGMTRETNGNRASHINGVSAAGADSTVDNLSWISYDYPSDYTSGGYYNGSAGEMVLVRRSMTADEVTKLEGYLAHKWGLANDLPTTHPYRYAPPMLEDAPTGAEIHLDANDPRSYPGSGTSWYDLSGNGRTHNLGTATYDLTDDIASINYTNPAGNAPYISAGSYTFNTEYTITGWAKSLTDAAVATWRTLWRTSGYHPILIQDATNIIGGYYGGFWSFGVTADAYENVWTHYTIVATGGNSLLYLNGVYIGTIGYNENGQSWADINLDSQPFGKVANTTVYGFPLTADQVLAHYNSQKAKFGH